MTARISSSLGRARRRPRGIGPDVLGHLLVEQVLGDRQDDRSGSSAERLAARLGHGVGDLGRRARLGCPLGQTADRRDLVDLLERLASADLPLDLADQDEHRGRILAGGVDADAEVRGTDRSRREADGGPAGQLAVRLGHECRPAFVTGRDDADAGAFEGVEEPEERLARDGEGVADTRCPQLVGDVAPNGPWTGIDDRFGGGLIGDCGVRGRVGLGRRLGFDGLIGFRCRIRVESLFGLGAGGLSDSIGMSGRFGLEQPLQARRRPRDRAPDQSRFRAPAGPMAPGS